MEIGDIQKEFQEILELCRTTSHESENCSEEVRIVMYESALLSAFRAYENFAEGVFLTFLSGCTYLSGADVPRFATPRDETHARSMLLSSTTGRFLEWSDAKKVMDRCQAYFGDDFRLLVAIKANMQRLGWLHKIRNQIAHNSVESRLAYTKVLESILVNNPTGSLSAGKFLQMRPVTGPLKGREVLGALFDDLENVVNYSVGIQDF